MPDPISVEPQPGETDSRVIDQPPGYSAPFTRRQVWSLIIPATIFVVFAVVLIWGLSSSAHGPNPLAVGTPTATTAPNVATDGTATQVALQVVTLPATAEPTTPPTATVQPTNTAPPTETAAPTNTSAPTASPTITAIPKILAGRRIALDPGHGPRNDLGAVFVDTNTNKLILTERSVNLDVALRTRDLLVARGAVVSMTRDTTDTFTLPWPPDTNGDGIEKGEADDLQQRIDIINASQAEVFLSIHMNSHANPAKRAGIQALYCASDDCRFPQQNKEVGLDVLDQLEQKLADIGYPITARELRSDSWTDTPGEPPGHLFLTGPKELPKHPRDVLMPGVTVEALYITSPIEVKELQLSSVRDAIALAYADALTTYLTDNPQQ